MKGCTPLPPPSAVLRDPAVDLLRFIGISMIFLAHIGPPAALFQLRSFDVPLMIFVSGLSYSGRQVVGYASFVRKRLGRLLIPLYLFLTVYFLVMWLLSECGVVEWFAARKVVGTYLLRLKPSINYVRIFRVFLIVMLLTPPLLRLERAVRDDRGFIALLAALFGLQALLTGWLKPLHLGFLVDELAALRRGLFHSVPGGRPHAVCRPAPEPVVLRYLPNGDGLRGGGHGGFDGNVAADAALQISPAGLFPAVGNDREPAAVEPAEILGALCSRAVRRCSSGGTPSGSICGTFPLPG